MSRYNTENPQNINQLAFKVCSQILHSKSMPVILCIGSSRVVADALGPMVADLLRNKQNISAYVYGGLSHNINYNNVSVAMDFIKQNHPHSKVLVVDAALGDVSEIGTVTFNSHGAIVGGGMHKNASIIGDYSLLGFVNTTGINNLMLLKGTKLKNVVAMANFVAESLSLALKIKQKIAPHMHAKQSKKHAKKHNRKQAVA